MKERSKELDVQIINLYNSGISKQNVARTLHVDGKYVKFVLDRNGINKDSRKLIKELEIIDYYNINKDRQDTAKHFNVSITTISSILRKHNVETKNTKHTFNENVFESIDTEEKAYWLGFIYADGSIQKRENTYVLEIELTLEDKEHLIKFNNFIEGDSKMIKIMHKFDKRYNRKYDQIRWTGVSKKLAEDLIKNGAGIRKTQTLMFPIFLDNNLIPHFIRGFFDGDGSISTKETGKSTLNVQLIGTKDMLEKCQEYSQVSKKLLQVKSKTNSNLFHFQIKVAQSIKFLNYIYNNASIYLTRKYNLWENFCRSNKKLLEGLEDKFGKDWDVNSEVTKCLNYAKYRNA